MGAEKGVLEFRVVRYSRFDSDEVKGFAVILALAFFFRSYTSGAFFRRYLHKPRAFLDDVVALRPFIVSFSPRALCRTANWSPEWPSSRVLSLRVSSAVPRATGNGNYGVVVTVIFSCHRT